MSNAECLDVTQYYQADSWPYGLTYGRWTVKWWQWFLSTPKSVNPVTDESGKFADVNQPTNRVWFLAGKVGDEHKIVPRRFCKIPASRSILFPVINCEVNPLECPELRTRRDLTEHVNADENNIIFKECTVDGKQVPVQRVKSDPSVFEVEINNNDAYGVKGRQITQAAADGYWVFLRPLSVGKHTISFRGSCEKGRLNSGADYQLQIH
jgi:hypothetical protein